MAQATTISTIQKELTNMSVTSQLGKDVPDEVTDETTTSYWTALLRKNLSNAMVKLAGSDAEDMAEIDEEVMMAPRRKSPREDLALEIAAQLYPGPPGSLAPIIKYEKDVVMLRSMYIVPN